MSEHASYPPHDLGAWGEDLAARRLEDDGWTVLERNLRWGRREIDLVVRRGITLAFVEVKTRKGLGYGSPEEAVTWKKRREIEAVARYYLARSGERDLDIRFDVIAIVADGACRVLSYRHIEDAWRPGW
jgi:putative endonuclease